MQRPRGHTLLLLDPTRELEFAPLEALVVACAHHGRQVRTLGGRRVDAAEVAAACGQVEVLHFAGHGDFDAASPYRSGVWLGPRRERGAIWTNADIFAGVQAPAGRLAVLSGCETGQTRPNFVSEEVSLPAALIAAGYAAVVASRWAVDDLSAALLMGEFHRRWRAGGTSVAAALAASRRWLRELTRPRALALLEGLAAAVAVEWPAQAARCRRLCARARRLLARGDELPFANPVYWAAFYASGDGAITADGVDPRVPPLSARRRSGQAR
jgi:CHAT domain-containing protein